jgi:altered-inheritance-of-mitochondria protein 5
LQFGGFTLTASILYLSVQAHRSNRLQQRQAIREQAQVINEIASPLGAYYRRFAPDAQQTPTVSVAEPRRPSAEELLKHQWNKEVETLAKKALSVRFEDVREDATKAIKTISRLLKRE